MGNVLRSVLILGVVWLAMGGPQPSWAADPVTVTLKPQNGSGESGTATLTDEGGKTKVVVSVTGQPAGTVRRESRPHHPGPVSAGVTVVVDRRTPA